MCRLRFSVSWLLFHSASDAFQPHSNALRLPLQRMSAPIKFTDVSADETQDIGDRRSIENNPCQVLLLDHLNINHERGRHDLLRAFYFDFLGCSIDPRKYDNYLSGRKTVWANIGLHQFHLPEGKPDAQVFDGVITIVHEDIVKLMERYNEFLDHDEKFSCLRGTQFHVQLGEEREEGEKDSGEKDIDDDLIMVTDPWGNRFCILHSDDAIEDRAEFLGAQPVVDGQGASEGLALEDLTVYVPHGSNLEGIGRFYQYVLGAFVVEELSSQNSISIAMGERQTLTFQYHPDGPLAQIQHDDLRYDVIDDDNTDTSIPLYPSNYGPHISLYISNLSHAYEMASNLDVLYVNPRFERKAYSKEEAIDQCMFRILDIVDPNDAKRNVILKLEHEIRAVKARDGTKYKSCPLLNVDV